MNFLIWRNIKLVSGFLELCVQNASAGLLIGASRPSLSEVGVPFEVRLQTYFHPVEFEANPPTRIWRVQNAYPKNQNKVQKNFVVQTPFLVPYQRRAATRPPQATIFFLTRGTEICRLVKFQLQWMQPTKVTVDSSCHFLKLFWSLPIFHFFIIPVFTKYITNSTFFQCVVRRVCPY